MKKQYDAVVIGAGAAGLMCASVAGARGRRVLLLDHAEAVGKKIRISGGGRCNFTNRVVGAQHFLSQNPHFGKSALGRYTPQDFMALVEEYGIAYHEKTLGQLFCDGSAQQIIDMLLAECEKHGVTLALGQSVQQVQSSESGGFVLELAGGAQLQTESLVVATGGLSIPKMGATDFGFRLAKQFGLSIVPPTPALVPLCFEVGGAEQAFCASLSGLALPVVASHGKTQFAEAMLFTHKGLSGPAILQISSYWQAGEPLQIHLLPAIGDVAGWLKQAKSHTPKKDIAALLAEVLPKRLAQSWCAREAVQGQLANLPDKRLQALGEGLACWEITPDDTTGFAFAEVTKGGVDTAELSSKTFESKQAQGLYFIGEVVDVTGHLGGYNFQWAWASGHACGEVV